MEVLANTIVAIISQYISGQINPLFPLKLYNVICQFYLNEDRKKKATLGPQPFMGRKQAETVPQFPKRKYPPMLFSDLANKDNFKKDLLEDRVIVKETNTEEAAPTV